MKIGIVSDIHADPLCLRRALDDMGSVDMMVCAGDSISEYRFCPETVEILRDRNVRCIQGNHEAVLLGGRNPHYLKKCQAEFSSELLEFLSTAPFSIEIDAEEAGARILITHASPLAPVRRLRLSRQSGPAPGRRAALRVHHPGTHSHADGPQDRQRNRNQSRLMLPTARPGPARFLRDSRHHRDGSRNPPLRPRLKSQIA